MGFFSSFKKALNGESEVTINAESHKADPVYIGEVDIAAHVEGDEEARCFIYDGRPLLKVPDGDITLTVLPKNLKIISTLTGAEGPLDKDGFTLAYKDRAVGYSNLKNNMIMNYYRKKKKAVTITATKSGMYAEGIPEVTAYVPNWIASWEFVFLERNGGSEVKTLTNIAEGTTNGKWRNPLPKNPGITELGSVSVKLFEPKKEGSKPPVELLDKDGETLMRCVGSNGSKYEYLVSLNGIDGLKGYLEMKEYESGSVLHNLHITLP